MWLHLLAPLLYSAVCLLYFHARELEGAHIYELFMTPLAIALPFVVALVCGLTVSQEERAGTSKILSALHYRNSFRILAK